MWRTGGSRTEINLFTTETNQGAEVEETASILEQIRDQLEKPKDSLPLQINLPIQHTSNQSVAEGKLCDTCSRVDLNRYVRPNIGKEAYNIENSPSRATKRLGKINDIHLKPDCDFCALVSKVIKLNMAGFDIPGIGELEVVLCTSYIAFVENAQGSQEEISQIRLEFLNASGQHVEFPLHHTLQLAQVGMSGNESYVSGDMLKGRSINKDGVDLGALRDWIDQCKAHHDHTCNHPQWISTLEKPTALKVLDVESLQVLHAPADTRYVALSYVWGNTQIPKPIPSPGNPGSRDYSEVFESLPLTIQDAITLMRRLGERYLWVDSMCINQADSDDSSTQIAQMDRIYGLADFTIVAAAGSDANAGLPGVRQGSRPVQQVSGSVKGIPLISALSASVPVDWSSWNQRGWTFQERLFSRRCVIFTGNQVYFQCKRRNWSEDTSIDEPSKANMNVVQEYRRFESLQSPAAMNFYQSLNYIPGPGIAGTLSSTNYETLVTEYSKRIFTYQSDALHAFKGVEKALSMKMPGRFNFGLPDILLDEALLWQSVLTTNPDFSPKQFPSFS